MGDAVGFIGLGTMGRPMAHVARADTPTATCGPAHRLAL